MQDALSGTITRLARKIPVPVINPAVTVESADFSSFDEGEINFDYCTEFIAARETDKDPDDLRKFLPTIGDCVVVVEDDKPAATAAPVFNIPAEEAPAAPVARPVSSLIDMPAGGTRRRREKKVEIIED